MIVAFTDLGTESKMKRNEFVFVVFAVMVAYAIVITPT